VKVPPLAIGAGAGLVLMLALAPVTGTALGKLSAARAELARQQAAATGPEPQPAALVVPALASGGDPASLAARIRDRAHNAGVLVEEIKLTQGKGALIKARISVSGTEKAVVALADALERSTPLLRFRGWRIAPIAGGLRLTGDAIAVRQ
jgi:hypothetical protein